MVNANNIGKKKNKTISKHEGQSQKIFKNCSEYLEQRMDSKSMHKDIGKLENFLFKVKQETNARNNKAPPIVLRSLEGFHEE